MIGEFNDSYFPHVDGVVTCVRNYARYIDRDHAPCRLYVPGIPGAVDSDGIPVTQFRSVTLPGQGGFRLGLPALDRAYRREIDAAAFDLVHCHSPFMSLQEAFRIRARQNVPVVGTFHTKFYDDFLTYTHSRAIARWGTAWVMERFARMDSVWTVNESTAETMRRYGYRGDVLVVPNGTDFAFGGDPRESRARAEAFLSITPETDMLLFVGQHILQKRIMMIAEAAEILRDRPHFRLFMAGDGAARRQLERWIDGHRMHGVITLLDPVRDRELLACLYLRAGAFVFPSAYDNAPLVVREAAAMGCPSILCAGTNAAEGVTDGENGFLCEGNAASLARCMARVMDDPVQAARVGAQARETLVIDWARVADMAFGHYERIIADYRKKHGPPRRP